MPPATPLAFAQGWLLLLCLVSCSARLDLGHDRTGDAGQTAPESRTAALCAGTPCFAGPVVELATSSGSARGLALDQSTLFWTASAAQALMATPKDGTPTTKIVAPPGEPAGVALDDENVYFTGGLGGYVAAVAKDLPKSLVPKAPKISLLASGEPNPQSIVVTSEGVYYADQAAGTINRVSLDGSLVETLVTGIASGCDLSLDAQFLYYSDSGLGELHALDRQTGLSELLLSGLRHPMAPLPHGAALYFLELGTEAASYADGRLLRMQRGASTVEVLLTNLDAPRALAADSSAVYLGTRGTAPNHLQGRIVRLADDGQVSTLATAQAEPFAVAVDDAAVYWTADAANGLYAISR